MPNDQSLPDDCHPNPKPNPKPNPNPNPTSWQLRLWRASAPLLIIVPMVIVGCILFLLIMFFILHATTVPDIHVDSASSLSLLHDQLVNTTTIVGDFLFRIKNRSPFVSVKHMDVKLNVYYGQNLSSTNISINSFIVGRLKHKNFTSSTNSTSPEIMQSWRSVVIVDVELEATRRLGIIGRDWWIFAFTLYASCDDMVFRRFSDGGNWTPLAHEECSIDSFFDYV